MRLRDLSGHRGVRYLGIGLLILGLVHPPLPQADFHNIRHHDAAGEVCALHDHLLRRHPDAGLAEDVAIFHWHWIFPLARSDGSDHAGPGPALHAHVPFDVAWPVSTYDAKPRVLPDTHSHLLARIIASPPPPFERPALTPAPPPIIRPTRALAFSATFAPRADLSCLFQRWVC